MHSEFELEEDRREAVRQAEEILGLSQSRGSLTPPPYIPRTPESGLKRFFNSEFWPAFFVFGLPSIGLAAWSLGSTNHIEALQHAGIAIGGIPAAIIGISIILSD